MANISVHLVIAQEWARKHGVENYDEFMWGSIAPDVLSHNGLSKKITHYRHYVEDDDIVERYANKVHIEEYLAENEILTDYDRGYYLHLLTDYNFYNKFLNPKALSKTFNSEQLEYALDQTFDATLKFVNEHYNLNYENSHIELEPYRLKYENGPYLEEEPILYTNEELAEFIDQMSDLSLDKK